jgi:hypothetical protein
MLLAMFMKLSEVFLATIFHTPVSALIIFAAISLALMNHCPYRTPFRCGSRKKLVVKFLEHMADDTNPSYCAWQGTV